MGKLFLKETEDGYVFLIDGSANSAHTGKTYNVQLEDHNVAEMMGKRI